MSKKRKKRKWSGMGVSGSVWENQKNKLRKLRREKMKVVNHLPGGMVITEDDYLGFQGQGIFVPPEPTHWETEDKMECIKDCSVAPDKKMVYISPLVYKKIKALMNKYKTREWLAYLIGKDEADSPGVFVADIYFPKQTASSAQVDDIELSAKVKVIGVMHSHHNMGNSFSGTDHEYINDNHNVSVLVSHKEITGQYRYITPCNRYKIVPITVQVHYDINFDEETFIKEADEKMNSFTTPSYPTHRYTQGAPARGVGAPPAEATSMPKDEDIEKALEELDFEKDIAGDVSLVDEFEGEDITEEDIEDATEEDIEAEQFMDECEEEDSLAEEMAKLGDVTVYDE